MLILFLLSFSLSADPFPVIPESYIHGYFYPDIDVITQNCNGENQLYNTYSFECQNVSPEQSYHPGRLYNISESNVVLLNESSCDSNQNQVLNVCIPKGPPSSPYSTICEQLYDRNDLLETCYNLLHLFELSHSANRAHPQSLQFFINQVVIQDYPFFTNQPYNSIFNSPQIGNHGYIYWPNDLPFFSYLIPQVSLSAVQTEEYITSHFKFAQVIQFYLARYKWNGEFIGFSPLTIQLNKCGQKNDIEQIWRKFGTNYKIECYFDLTREINEETNEFYELFIEDGKTDNGVIMRPIPILFNNTLGRRFYKFNNLTKNGVKFIKESFLNITITQIFKTYSTIQIPYFAFNTSQVPFQSLTALNTELKFNSDTETHPKFKFEVVNTTGRNPLGTPFLGIVIALTIVFGTLIAIRCYLISDTDNIYKNDRMIILKFLAAFLETAGYFFFTVVILLSLFVFIVFKFQKQLFYCLTPGNEETFRDLWILTLVCLIAQIISILLRIVIQSTNYFIIVDWEDSDKKEDSVSAWRKINAANEFSRICTLRSYNISFTVISVIFIMCGFNVRFLSNSIPSSRLIDIESDHWVLRFALSSIIWLILMAIQYIWFHYIYWRFYGNPFFNFLDLCYASNLSVFAVTSKSHSYYLHGRSVQGKTDVTMKKLAQAIVDEEEGAVGLRGLAPNKPEQVFEVYFTRDFSNDMLKMYNDLVNPYGKSLFKFFFHAGEFKEDSFKTYKEISIFLKDFIKLNGKYKYEIREKGVLQKMAGSYPDILDDSVFSPIKDTLFKRSLLSGIEWPMMMAYLIIFVFIDMHSKRPTIAGAVIFILDFLLTSFYKLTFKANIAKTSLIDTKFLFG